MPCLEITTMVGCPLKCTFCPQDALKSAYGKGKKYLSLDDFKTVVAKLPPYVRVDFSGMAEPWANPAATDMLEYALRVGFNVTVYTTLYGMKDHDRVIALLTEHAGQVEAVVLHLPDANGNMRGFKPSPAYSERLEAFLRLRDGGVLRHFDMMTMDGSGAVHEALSMSLPPWTGLSRAGNLDADQIGGQRVEETPSHLSPVGCSYTPFYDHNVLLPNGDVVLCCMDYSVKHKVGNLIEGDYWSLFSSPGMNELRIANMHYGCNGSICRKCSRATRYERAEGRNQFWEITT